MKSFIIFLLFISFHSPAQHIAMIDMKLKNEPVLMDRYSVNDYFEGRFPIYKADIDSTVKYIHLASTFIDQATVKQYEKAFKFGHSELKLAINQIGESFYYAVSLTTTTVEATFNFDIVNYTVYKRKAQTKLITLIDYLQNKGLTMLTK